MLALKSGIMAGDSVSNAIKTNNFCPSQFSEYSTTLREGIENMRKLVYAFYNPNFTFKDITEKYPELTGDITDCLSGDVNKDFTKLWEAFEEFCDIPKNLNYGQPLVA